MKRHEILAAIAAAAGLTLATTAHAGLPSNFKQPLPTADSMVTLQALVGQDSDLALSQMIHLAKAKGEKASKTEKTNDSSKAQGFAKSDNPKASGGPLNPGKGNKHNPS